MRPALATAISAISRLVAALGLGPGTFSMPLRVFAAAR
jgi:hypothetical protein